MNTRFIMYTRSLMNRTVLVVSAFALIAVSSLLTFLSRADVKGMASLSLEAPARIYCRSYLPADGCMCEIGGNGKQVRALPPGVSGEPSRQLHSSRRWFACVRASGGRAGAESATSYGLCVVRDDGLTIALPLPAGVEPLTGSVRWPLDTGDRTLTWIGRRRDASGAIVEGGIYTTQLEYDAQDCIVAAKQQNNFPVVPLPLVPYTDVDQWPDSPLPDAESQDWSPDGSSVVIVSLKGALSIVKVGTGETMRLSVPPASGAVWSPDGSLIAFKVREPLGGIAVVEANGEAAEVVFGPEQGIPFAVTEPHWLPSDSRLVIGYVTAEYVAPEQPVKLALIVLDLVKGRYETVAAEVAGSVIPVACR